LTQNAFRIAVLARKLPTNHRIEEKLDSFTQYSRELLYCTAEFGAGLSASHACGIKARGERNDAWKSRGGGRVERGDSQSGRIGLSRGEALRSADRACGLALAEGRQMRLAAQT
jgi:hypothetical protein